MTQTVDFFRARLDAMIDLRHPLAVLAPRLPWSRLEAELAPIWRRQARNGVLPEGEDWFGSGGVLVAAGVSHAGRSRLPIRLMCSLLYLKHAFNLFGIDSPPLAA
jgi:transposase, IS5 family